MKIIKIFILSFIGLCLFFMGLIYYTYFIVPDPRAEWASLRSDFKSLSIESDMNEGYYSTIIDFCYTDQELSQYPKSRADSMKIYNNGNDSINIYLQGGNLSILKKLPISVFDSIPFPKNFSIKIYTKDYTKLLKDIDFQEFKNLVEAKYMRSKNNFLTATVWVLTIDSTLLGLDKLKIDSIR